LFRYERPQIHHLILKAPASHSILILKAPASHSILILKAPASHSILILRCEPTGPAFGRPDDELREPRRMAIGVFAAILRDALLRNAPQDQD